MGTRSSSYPTLLVILSNFSIPRNNQREVYQKRAPTDPSVMNTIQKHDELFVDETNKEVTVHTKNFTYRFGPYPTTLYGPSSSQDEETYFRAWRRLSSVRMSTVELRLQIVCTTFYYGPEHEAWKVWQEEMEKVARRLGEIMAQLDNVEKVRQEKLSEFLLRP